jgi:hypothetical protein
MTHSRLRGALLLSGRFFLIGAFTAGCATTQTSVSVRATPQAPTSRVRLLRPEEPALTAQWRQEGRTLVGQLAFATSCQTETVQLTRREQVTDTHPSKPYVTAAYVVGGLVSILGVGLLVSSTDKDDTVTCGGGDAPKAGDRCDSEAGAWRTLGAVTLGTGLGSILGGILVQSKKPVIESAPLPSEERVTIKPGAVSCGDIKSLEGATVSAVLPDGGTWSAPVNATGAVRIALSPAIVLHGGEPVRFVVMPLPTAPSTLLRSGSSVGSLALTAVRDAPPVAKPASSRPTAQR